jgi:hypothetical protein
MSQQISADAGLDCDTAAVPVADAPESRTESQTAALENQKPGMPESIWQVDPGNDSTKLEGFTTAIGTNIGGSGDLTAPASSNGVYAYGSSSLFPTNSFNATSYGVDVVFKQLAA